MRGLPLFIASIEERQSKATAPRRAWTEDWRAPDPDASRRNRSRAARVQFASCFDLSSFLILLLNAEKQAQSSALGRRDILKIILLQYLTPHT
jgi:hypothetical protein